MTRPADCVRNREPAALPDEVTLVRAPSSRARARVVGQTLHWIYVQIPDERRPRAISRNTGHERGAKNDPTRDFYRLCPADIARLVGVANEVEAT